MAAKKKMQSDADIALKTLDMLQELVWAIRSREPNELLTGVSHLRRLATGEKALGTNIGKRTTLADKRRDLKSLVGSMSLVLADVELFPANEDIAKFANEALQIPITRWEKRSRYEMIGMLIMESINANPTRLKDVVSLLERISNESESMTQIKSRARQTGFSWNEAIRSMSTAVE